MIRTLIKAKDLLWMTVITLAFCTSGIAEIPHMA